MAVLALALRLIPQRVHLLQRCLLERASLRRQRALDIGETALEFGVGAAQRAFGIGADMAGQVDQREQEVAGFVGELFGIAVVQRGLDLVGLFADLGSTARGSFQSKPTVDALRCNSIARVSAGWPALTPDSSDLCVVSSGGRRAARSAFSSALMRSQALLTPAGAILPSLSANTCGWRRIILRVIASTTSPKAKASCSSAMRA